MENLKKIYQDIRKIRNFNSEVYLKEKTKKINNFFKNNNLNSCVIGISGGIDSALTYKLLLEAQKQNNSPLKKIVPLILPIKSKGTSNQDKATKHGIELLENCGIENAKSYVKDLTPSLNEYVNTNGKDGLTDWNIGQLASIVRTPYLYFQAAILQSRNYNSIVVGTTNRDEGSYIGFFGKASDAMVDLQPIADLHKSEVIELSKFLGIPNSIIERSPQGDVYDGKKDEEMIGAPYWVLELFLLRKDLINSKKVSDIITIQFSNLPKNELRYYENCVKNIENLHNKNKHKYEVGQPSHFIDVQKRSIEGGW